MEPLTLIVRTVYINISPAALLRDRRSSPADPWRIPMSLYAIAVFLHIVGALGLFAALGLEWASLLNLRRATAAGQAREWVRVLASLRTVAGPAGLTILVTGIYLTATRWGGQGWIGVGLGGVVLIAVLGATLTGRRTRAIARAVASAAGAGSAALGDRLRDPVLMLSAWLRTALALGIVFVMSTKPSGAGALTAVGVALGLGFAAGLPAWGRGRRAGTPAQAPTARDHGSLTSA